MEKNRHDFEWNSIITKSVYTDDNKHVGHVDGLNDAGFVVKDKILHARYYLIPRELLDTYEYGKVKLKISEEELNSKYRRDRPGYFEGSV
jgi:hypothetical protein